MRASGTVPFASLSDRMATTGAHLLVDALADAGVTHLFTLSGNQILSVYDAAIERGLRLVHTRHEAAAVHMADAWGRLTDEPGVALVTAGPGHANALSALYGAAMSESPLVLLSGHAPRAQLGSGAFQEMDQVAAARPMTKAAWRVDEPASLGDEMRRALAIARSGRPGPVQVSLPGDVLEAPVSAAHRATADAASDVRGDGIDDALARQIVDGLVGAERPLILTAPSMGRGRRWQAVATLAEATGIPALPIESPRGVNDPWLHAAGAMFATADVVLLLGKPLDFSLRFGKPPTFAAGCRFLQIAPGAPLPPTGDRVDLAVGADPWRTTEELVRHATGRTWTKRRWTSDVETSRRWTPETWHAARRSSTAPIHPLRVAAALAPYVDAGAIFVCDGGEFGQWQQAGVEPRERLINGLSGSIGSAIPMAIAAKLARPDRLTLAAVGDGTFGFHGFELDTAARYRVPVVVVVGNDARWNAEYQLQLQHYGRDRAVGCELLPARYDLVAQALGAHGELVEHPDELEPALDRAVRSGRPACVNVTIDGLAAPTFQARAEGH